ncbi:MAG TPA: hypothetical protein VHI71_03735 [Actinomycetota bacterium]|nr:hypothetical protein [Actinomycetota bacterium]
MRRGARARSLAAMIASAIVMTGPARAAPARTLGWSVVAQCYEVTAGGTSVVWGYAIALGPATATAITCRIGDTTACSVAMPGPMASCTDSRPSAAAVALPTTVCGVGSATFTDGTTTETHTC